MPLFASLTALASLASLAPLPAAAQSGAPAVTGVSITSRPSLRSSNPDVYWPYQRDDHIDVTVTFSRAVTVTGSPRLALTVGTRTRQAAFRSASGSTVSFRYTTIGGDRDTDGIAIAADALTLNGGSIEAGSVAAALDLGSHALGNQSNHRVAGEGPTFDGVAAPRLRLHARRARQLHVAGGGLGEDFQHLRAGGDAGAARRPVLRCGDPHPLRYAGGGDGADDLHAQRQPSNS